MPANYDQPDYVEKRVRYFDGQFLQDQDFIDDQKYFLDRQRRSTRSLQVSGICEGLQLTSDTDIVTVEPGTALDRQGRQIVLGAKESVPLSDYRGQAVDLLIAYQAIPTDPAQEGSEGNTRWHEQPQLVVVLVPLNPTENDGSTFETIDQNGSVIEIEIQDPVRLGQLAIDQDGNVNVNLNDPFRQYSGVNLPTHNGSGPILRSGGDQAGGLAILTGDLSITGAVGIGTRTPTAKLEVEGDIHTNAAAIRGPNGNLYASFSHVEQGYALLQRSDGETYLNASTSKNVRFRINNSDQMILNSAGDIGIGTTSPNSKLEVNGDIRTNVALISDPFGANYAAFSYNSQGTTSSYALLQRNDGQTYLNAPTGQSVRFRINNDDKMILSSAGNVGIGTTSPEAALEINASTQTANNWFEAIRFSRSEHSAITHPEGGLLLGLHSNRNFYFADIKDGTLQKYVMQIDADTGNVGIGITNPSEKLDVNGDIRTKSTLISDAVYGTSYAAFSHRSRSNREGYALLQHSGGSTYLNGKTVYFRISNLTKMTLTNAGNLGIGTSSPGAKLHVNGDIRTNVALISDNPHGASYAAFSHRSQATAGGYALLQHSSGQTFLNAASGKSIYFRSNNSNRMTLTSAGNLGIGTTNPQAKLHVIGQLRVTNVPYGDKRNMQWDNSTGLLYYDNSTQKHKENIIDLEDDFSKILEANPKTYTRPGNSEEWEIGYLAEEFHDLGLSHLIHYDEEGDPEAINYRKISLYLVEVVKNLNQRLKLCSDKVEALENR